jgi:predicted negative regulator of RcsB-dependent stress response
MLEMLRKGDISLLKEQSELARKNYDASHEAMERIRDARNAMAKGLLSK